MPAAAPATLRCLLLCAALAALTGCRSGAPVEDHLVDPGCLKHEDCDAGSACVLGTCTSGAWDDAPDLDGFDASPWYTDPDGVCSFDTDCGPWMCVDGACAPPSEARRPVLPLSEYRYWDMSCYAPSDCGRWICADGWCTQPGYAAPSARILAASAPREGPPCLADDACMGADADCVHPGVCVDGAAGELMTFVELGGNDWYDDPDAACISDVDCGPHACVGGACIAHELTDRDRPRRDAFRYYDASCSVDADCGDWVCRAGWCNDPAYTSDQAFGILGSIGGADWEDEAWMSDVLATAEDVDWIGTLEGDWEDALIGSSDAEMGGEFGGIVGGGVVGGLDGYSGVTGLGAVDEIGIWDETPPLDPVEPSLLVGVWELDLYVPLDPYDGRVDFVDAAWLELEFADDGTMLVRYLNPSSDSLPERAGTWTATVVDDATLSLTTRDAGGAGYTLTVSFEWSDMAYIAPGGSDDSTTMFRVE